MTQSAERWAAQATTTDPSGRTTADGAMAVSAAGDSVAVADQPPDAASTRALIWLLFVHTTTAGPDARPAVVSVVELESVSVASVTGADHAVAASAWAGTMTPAATPLASTTAGNTRRNVPERKTR